MSELVCPMSGKRKMTNEDWWPNQVNLSVLHQNSALSNPMSKGFNYTKEFNTLDYYQVKNDLKELMIHSKEWWPADYNNYGPLMIRMAWHSAGTYRTSDGRGGASRGTQRLAPINSWPDNANLDKARRLLWPIKEKYGNKLSWADLMILAGNCALEQMGVETIGFAGGREDVWEPQIDEYWGSETKWLEDKRYTDNRKLEDPLAAVQMGLIYVNPEGPNGNPDPSKSAIDVRETFARMAMNDEETVALIAGGHTFGKCHGAASAKYVGPEPEGAPLQEQGLGWKNTYKTGNADNTITSGIEGAWKPNPTTWDMGYLKVLFKYEWELVKSPAGAYQWLAKNVMPEDLVEDAHDITKKHRPIMTTADLSLLYDPIYKKIAKSYLEHPEKFKKAFANAWFKLTHRDMGPVTRYLGPEIPKETFIWQDPIPYSFRRVLDERQIETLKYYIINSGLTISDVVKTAWASAATFRGSDRRGGANGARIQLLPQREWEVNEPERLQGVLNIYRTIMRNYNTKYNKENVSLADLIILGGCVGIEQAIKNTGYMVTIPFLPGRMDALQEQTDIQSFAVLEPTTDGFRNYVKNKEECRPEDALINKAQLLQLTAPEMTVLLGGMRVLNVNYKDSTFGVFTERKNCLTNDFFINLLDMRTIWEPISEQEQIFKGIDRKTKMIKWNATRVDLLFGSNSQLRAISEVYASKENEMKFIQDFIMAWNKVMNADRFDVQRIRSF
ncbi:MAG: catalase/peroxidase HPI [Lachnospiraceae bacterium]